MGIIQVSLPFSFFTTAVMPAFSEPVFITTPRKPPSTSTNRDTPRALAKPSMGAMTTSDTLAGVMAGMNWVMMATTMVIRISTVNAVGIRNCVFRFSTKIAPFDRWKLAPLREMPRQTLRINAKRRLTGLKMLCRICS